MEDLGEANLEAVLFHRVSVMLQNSEPFLAMNVKML